MQYQRNAAADDRGAVRIRPTWRNVRHRVAGAVNSVIVLAVVMGCSSGSDAGPTQPPTTVTITSLDADDGSLFGAGNTGTGAVCCGFASAMYVGQRNGTSSPLSGNFVPGTSRGYVRFLLTEIPAGKTIVSATLRLQQASPGAFNTTPDPYPTFGSVLLDHVDFGTTIEGDDFARAPLSSTTATLSSTYVKELKTADVAAFVQADVTAGRGRSDFRLRFATETLPLSASLVLGTYFNETSPGLVTAGPVPSLVVTYR